jgi:hypothetical protein
MDQVCMRDVSGKKGGGEEGEIRYVEEHDGAFGNLETHVRVVAGDGVRDAC